MNGEAGQAMSRSEVNQTVELMFEVVRTQAALDEAAERRASRKQFRGAVDTFIALGYPRRFRFISMELRRLLSETLDEEAAEVSRRPEAYRGERFIRLELLAADRELYGLDD